MAVIEKRGPGPHMTHVLTVSVVELFFLAKCLEASEDRGYFIGGWHLSPFLQSFIWLGLCMALHIQKYASLSNIYLLANVAICLIIYWKMLNKINK